MDLSVPSNARYGIWLRAPSSSGGKDWLGFVTDTEVVSHWGRTGKIVQSKVLSNRPSRQDLQRKVNEKISKGYRILGDYDPAHGWSHQQGAPPIRQAALSPPAPAADREADSELRRWISDTSQPWF